MRQYKIEETKAVEKIICNKCGREILVRNEIPDEDVLDVRKRWGYFSEKDNEVHSFDICERCYDEWIQTFRIPIEKR
jgi:hypothetical protein